MAIKVDSALLEGKLEVNNIFLDATERKGDRAPHWRAPREWYLLCRHLQPHKRPRRLVHLIEAKNLPEAKKLLLKFIRQRGVRVVDEEDALDRLESVSHRLRQH